MREERKAAEARLMQPFQDGMLGHSTIRTSLLYVIVKTTGGKALARRRSTASSRRKTALEVMLHFVWTEIAPGIKLHTSADIALQPDSALAGTAPGRLTSIDRLNGSLCEATPPTPSNSLPRPDPQPSCWSGCYRWARRTLGHVGDLLTFRTCWGGRGAAEDDDEYGASEDGRNKQTKFATPPAKGNGAGVAATTAGEPTPAPVSKAQDARTYRDSAIDGVQDGACDTQADADSRRRGATELMDVSHGPSFANNVSIASVTPTEENPKPHDNDTQADDGDDAAGPRTPHIFTSSHQQPAEQHDRRVITPGGDVDIPAEESPVQLYDIGTGAPVPPAQTTVNSTLDKTGGGDPPNSRSTEAIIERPVHAASSQEAEHAPTAFGLVKESGLQTSHEGSDISQITEEEIFEPPAEEEVVEEPSHLVYDEIFTDAWKPLYARTLRKYRDANPTSTRYPIPAHSRVCGRGTYATAYLATEEHGYNDRCVIKASVCLPTMEADDFKKHAETAAREANAYLLLQTRLQIPYMLRCHGAGVVDCVVFLCLEEAQAGTLKSLVYDVKDEEVMVFLAACLGYAIYTFGGHTHQRDKRGCYVHRDLKPDNILLHADGRPAIADFGLMLCLKTPDQTIDIPAGTPGYMAPEVEALEAAMETNLKRWEERGKRREEREAQGVDEEEEPLVREEEHPYTRWCDIWSLGTILNALVHDDHHDISESMLQLIKRLTADKPTGRPTWAQFTAYECFRGVNWHAVAEGQLKVPEAVRIHAASEAAWNVQQL